MAKVSSSAPYRLIPYGMSDFEKIRLENKLFVDKTRFIRKLETYHYIFFIRPRRFGKSCWISILESYYDLAKASLFDTVFANTDIGQDPTPEHSSYLILTFDFSVIRADPEVVENQFEAYVKQTLSFFLRKYAEAFPHEIQQQIQEQSTVSAQLQTLFAYARQASLKIYVLIDEYDNFANTILTSVGMTAYHQFTHGQGFYRNFFAVLKEGTSKSGSGLSRLFITGVSPIPLDDVTSGFNIGKNLSLSPEFNEMVGLTETEVRQILEYYQQAGVFDQDLNTTLALMREWYNGYRFATRATNDLFNTDMVLYYLTECIPNAPGPDELIDTNIRIDYTKLKQLMMINQKLNGNFDRLKTIIENGLITTQLIGSFSLNQLTQPKSFLSLLHYLGLLSIVKKQLSQVVLQIPNRTVQELMYGYMRDSYEEAQVFRINLEHFASLVDAMALNGDWKPVFTFLAEAIEQQTSVRDYLQGEKVIQGFLLAYLNVSNPFLCHSEREFSKGFVDLFLEPFLDQYPEIPYGFLIELKYLKRQETLKTSNVEYTVAEAKSQLRTYLQDRSLHKYASVTFMGIVLVFHGWEMIVCEVLEGSPPQ